MILLRGIAIAFLGCDSQYFPLVSLSGPVDAILQAELSKKSKDTAEKMYLTKLVD